MATIIEIKDFSAPELDVYARLTENQLVCRRDPAQGLFIAESPVVIERALGGGCEPVSFLMETKHVTGKGAKNPGLEISVSEAPGTKCPRCWMHSVDADPETGLCPRCKAVVAKL